MECTRRTFNTAVVSAVVAGTAARVVGGEAGATMPAKQQQGGDVGEKSDLRLWYQRPAREWLEALPVGNGRLGGMVFGGVPEERVQFNDDTLWSGGPRDWDNPKAREALPEVRRLVFAGKYAEAHEACKRMMGPYTQAYMPMGDLRLKFRHAGEAGAYERELDLDAATVRVRYEVGGVTFAREVFSSNPGQVMVMRLTASKPGALSFSVGLTSQLRPATESRDGVLVLKGRAPSHADPSYYRHPKAVVEWGDEGMAFECHVKVVADGGRVTVNDEAVEVEAADGATLILGAATSFNGRDKSPGREGRDPGPVAAAQLAKAVEVGYARLRDEHLADHRRLFRRVSVNLGPAAGGALDVPTDERVQQFGATDPGLVALHFQYGRYLLIASSREGTQPPNLQGIWNDSVTPPWSSNWTLNINAEMNQWPAEVCNLAECHRPLLDLTEALSRTGAKTARTNYGCAGWVAHHNADVWAQSAPVGAYGHGDATWAMWPMAGPWLCHHLWEHYRFGGDVGFLRGRAYPVMKGAAEFCLDFLVDDGRGHLVTCPSTSPEHRFVAPGGKTVAVSAGSTMDMALIWDLFTNCIAAGEALGVDADFRKRLAEARARLLLPRVGSDGRLPEWSHELPDAEPHHRHVSHLWGVHPGNQITRTTAPELLAAARKSMEVRGDEGTGWSSGWKINLWARLGDGDHAFELIRRTLRLGNGGVYANLFGSHPPFQMDGNFAFPAGVAEMLLQSHDGFVDLLPALPKAWPTGGVTGLRARGGFELDLAWEQGGLKRATLRSVRGGKCVVGYRDKRVTVDTERGGSYRLEDRL